MSKVLEMKKMSRMKLRLAISRLEKQKPKNLIEFKFREDEIKRYLDLIINGEKDE